MVKRLKDENAPKKPLSGFFLYGSHLRATDSSIKALKVTEQGSAISEKWNNLDQVEKQTYLDKAEALKQQYAKDFEEYKKSDSYKDFQVQLKESKESKDKPKKKRGPTKMSGYRLFVKENKDIINDDLDDESQGKRHIAKCGLKWNRLSETEKNAYNERAAKMETDKAAIVNDVSEDDE